MNQNVKIVKTSEANKPHKLPLNIGLFKQIKARRNLYFIYHIQLVSEGGFDFFWWSFRTKSRVFQTESSGGFTRELVSPPI